MRIGKSSYGKDLRMISCFSNGVLNLKTIQESVSQRQRSRVQGANGFELVQGVRAGCALHRAKRAEAERLR